MRSRPTTNSKQPRQRTAHSVVAANPKDRQSTSNDEAYCTKNANGREIFHGVEAGTLQGVVRNRVRQGQSGHVGRHTQRVPRENVGKGDLIVHADPTDHDHKDGRHEMTERQHALSLHITVCQHADNSGHKDGHKALHGIKTSQCWLPCPYRPKIRPWK